MRINFIVVALLALSCSMAVGQGSHEWRSISYPDLPTQFASGTSAPTIRCSDDGIQFSLAFSWSDDDAKEDSFKLPNGSEIKLQLHYTNEKIVEPSNSTFDGELMTFGRRGYSSGSFTCTFPWSENEMLEGWLHVSTSGREYWLEIPYGFTRDPKIEKLPTAKTGPPELPAALKPFPEKSHIVNWKLVNYDLGEIQNGGGFRCNMPTRLMQILRLFYIETTPPLERACSYGTSTSRKQDCP